MARTRTKEGKQDNPLRGRTLRWTLEEGSMAGMTFEHHFYADDTVAYRTVDEDAEDKQSRKPDAEDRPRYKAFQISDDVVLASYLGESGYTLTLALNFDDGRIAGFASNNEEWFPCEGTFEEVEERSVRRAA